MPSPEFFAGLLALALTFAAALALAVLTGISPTWTLIATALLIWGAVAYAARRSNQNAQPPSNPIHVDWKDRLNDTDFALGHATERDLSDTGKSPEKALGDALVFATCDDTGTEIWFEGILIRDGDQILIRATEPV